jgi:hypothetical protein
MAGTFIYRRALPSGPPRGAVNDAISLSEPRLAVNPRPAALHGAALGSQRPTAVIRAPTEVSPKRTFSFLASGAMHQPWSRESGLATPAIPRLEGLQSIADNQHARLSAMVG